MRRPIRWPNIDSVRCKGVWISNGLCLRPKGNSYTCSRKFRSFNSKDNVFPSFIDLPPSPPCRHILRRRGRSYHHHFFDLNLIIELICPKYQPILLIEASSGGTLVLATEIKWRIGTESNNKPRVISPWKDLYTVVTINQQKDGRINTSETEACSDEMMDWRRRIKKALNQVIGYSFPYYA